MNFDYEGDTDKELAAALRWIIVLLRKRGYNVKVSTSVIKSRVILAPDDDIIIMKCEHI